MIGRTIAVGGASLLCGLFAYAPAAKLVPQLIPNNADIKLYEISGTLMQGSAGRISARGTGADNLYWNFHPTWLLLGKAAGHVELSYGNSDLQKDNAWLRADVRYSFTGKRLNLRDLTAAAGLEALQKPLNVSYLPVSGTLSLSLDALDLDLSSQPTPWPTDVSGAVELLDTKWKLGTPASLGRFAAQITTQDDGTLMLNIEDTPDAAVALRGSASVAPDRSYQAQLQIKPKQETPANVANQMKALGRTDSQGWYPIRQNGQIPGL